MTARSLRPALFVTIAVLTGCGAGGGADDGRTVARLVLGDDADAAAIDCVTDELEARLDDAVLGRAAAVTDPVELDLPTRRQLIEAALACVPATELSPG